MKKLSMSLLASALVLTLAGCTTVSSPAQPSLELLLSGTYNFTMDVGTQYLSGSSCPSQAASTVSSGPATVAAGATPDDVINVTIESTTLTFAPLDGNEYNTGPMPFPTKDGNDNPVTGTAYFEMTVQDAGTASGVLIWDNTQGCKGTYPFTLEYLAS